LLAYGRGPVISQENIQTIAIPQVSITIGIVESDPNGVIRDY